MPKHTQPEFAERCVEHSVTNVAQLAADLASQLLCNSEVRLARVLLTLADCDSGEAVSRPCRP